MDMLRTSFALVCCAALVVSAACGRTDTAPMMDDDLDMEGGAAVSDARPALHVAIEPTEGNRAVGALMLAQTDDGVEITGRISGLPADRDVAIHIHEIGDCSAPDASTTGEHLNPDNEPHGDPDTDMHHLGDMPNLDVDDDGVAEVDVSIDGAMLGGSASRTLLNRAIVIHAEADDFETQPAGGSGDRIGCGTIPASSMDDPARVGESLDATSPAAIEEP
jgi:Cu-Zn family superoxide dismutase